MVALLAKRPSTEKATWTTKFEFCPCHVSELSKCFNIRNGSWHDHAWTKTIFLKKNWPHPPWPYSRDRREWKPIQCLGAILAGNNSYPKDPRWHQNGISDSDCTNFAKGIRTFRHWVSPDKKTVLLIVESWLHETLIVWSAFGLLWFFSGVQGHRDKKGIYTTWIALSWTENFEQFSDAITRKFPWK